MNDTKRPRPYVDVPAFLVPTLDAYADAWVLAKTGILGAMLEAWQATGAQERAFLATDAEGDHGPVVKQYARLAHATGEAFLAAAEAAHLPVPAFVYALALRWAQLAPEEQERFAVPWAADAVKRGTIAWSLLSRLAQGPVGSADIQRAIGHEGAEVAGVWIAWLRARGLAEHVEWGQWAISERGRVVAKYPRTEAFSGKEKGRTK
jgi:hypothetical protein